MVHTGYGCFTKSRNDLYNAAWTIPRVPHVVIQCSFSSVSRIYFDEAALPIEFSIAHRYKKFYLHRPPSLFLVSQSGALREPGQKKAH